MSKASVGQSELHLKRELTALQKARYLRDPETCSSWRSPLSSRPFVAKSKLTYLNGMIEKFSGEINHGSPLKMPSKGRSGKKKLYTCNWRHNSIKSSARMQNREGSDRGSPQNNFSLSKSLIVDSRSDICLEVPANFYNVAGTDSGTPVRRSIKQFRRRMISKRGTIKHLAASKVIDTASSSLGILDSGEHSDESEDYNSEDLQHLKHDLTQKIGHVSQSASPFYGTQSYLSKIARTSKRVTSSQSCTPASTSSYYKYGGQEPSTVGSWDGTGDGDELDQPELQKSQGCGIPCYWSKKAKDRGVGGFRSPSLSFSLRRKGSSILCGGQTLYNKKKSSSCHKQNHMAKYSQGVPLQTNSFDVDHPSLDTTSDELSSKLGELDLEALSRLDGRRWSTCKSQVGVEIADVAGGNFPEVTEERTLSQKYRPKFFSDIVGQNIVVQSLSNAISKGKIACAYLFHGPRGSGKTSAARIFSAALNCLSTSKENKPCLSCRECSTFSSRNGSNLKEVNATNKMSMDQVRQLLKSLSLANVISQYRVFAIDECHMLSSKNWSMFMKFLEEPLPHVVFIFMTIDPVNLPRAIISRCQKYIFSKVKDVDIVSRLKNLCVKENLDVELDALDSIASSSNGSLRDAEIMLDQLSLLGKKITTSLVNDLVGVVPDEKLLDLLEIAMSSDTAETVKRSRKLIDSGVDPMALMSQLAGLIMDIIAGTHRLTNSLSGDKAIGGRSLNESELERLQLALKILSDAEKQLRHSSERSTWFTAALLQLGSGHNLDPNRSSSSSRQSARRISSVVSDVEKLSTVCENRRSIHQILVDNDQKNVVTSKEAFGSTSPEKLDEIWSLCIHRCHSNTLRNLLSSNGRLLWVGENEGALVAVVGFENPTMKSRAERFLSSITNSMEIVLGRNVDVRIELVPNIFTEGLRSVPYLLCNKTTNDNRRDLESDLGSYSDKGRIKGNKILDSCKGNGSHLDKERCNRVSSRRRPKAGIDEQKLESAWLQAAEVGYLCQPKPDKNQVLPQIGVNRQPCEQAKLVKHQDTELDTKIKVLKVSATDSSIKEHMDGINHYAISPSLLHCSNKTANCEKETMGYESGPSCNGLLCWKPLKNNRGKVKHGIHLRTLKPRRLSLFSPCGKAEAAERKSKK